MKKQQNFIMEMLITPLMLISYLIFVISFTKAGFFIPNFTPQNTQKVPL